MELYDFDPDTLRLTLALELEELDGLTQEINRNGKNREGEVPDSIAAIELYRRDLSDCAKLLPDQTRSESPARSANLNKDAVRDLQAQEDLAARDRQLPLHLSGITNPTAATTTAGAINTHLGLWRCDVCGE